MAALHSLHGRGIEIEGERMLGLEQVKEKEKKREKHRCERGRNRKNESDHLN